MYRQIVVGYDGSPASRQAVDTAIAIALQNGAMLHVLTVARLLQIPDEVETEAIVENSREFHQRLLDELALSIGDAGAPIQYEIAIGHPAEQIIYRADQLDADLIVVGDRGRSKIKRMLLGSVSDRVVRHADRAVMVVR